MKIYYHLIITKWERPMIVMHDYETAEAAFADAKMWQEDSYFVRADTKTAEELDKARKEVAKCAAKAK